MGRRSSSTADAKVASRIIGIMLLLVSGLAMIIGSRTYYKNVEAEAKCTATTAATVVDYKKTVTKTSKKKNKNSRHKTTTTRTTYSPIYEFTVDGKTYRDSDSNAASATQRYAIGTKLEVHYEPGDPDNNYLLKTEKIVLYASLGGGGFFFLIGLIGLAGKLTGKAR